MGEGLAAPEQPGDSLIGLFQEKNLRLRTAATIERWTT
jgi:hypothetical protein